MLPPYLLNLIYIVGGVLIAVLLARIVYKWFAKKPSAGTSSTPVESEAPSVAQEQPQTVNGVYDSPSYRTKLFTDDSLEEEELSKLDSEEVGHHDGSDRVLGPATGTLAQMLPETEERHREWRKTLRTAGYLSPHAMQNFNALRYLAIILPLLVLGGLLLIVPKTLEIPLLIAILVVPAVCWALAGIYVRNLAQERKNAIEQGLPDAVDMLNMCVSQGLTVQHSFGRISKQIKPAYPDLSQEFAIVEEQADIGSLPQALDNFADRVDIPEVHSFTTLLTQTDRMGTSVSQALTDYSDSVREGLRQRADEKANKAGFKLLFPTVLCLMPAVYMFLLGPAIVAWNDFSKDGLDLIRGSRAMIEEAGIDSDTPVQP
ncbi:type II secretion system F family protein [Calycomorphotria hydatis]|uniref:Bacterial type II secretion system protein F domain protein n=1 Tax=Calycomorphotria hydatis TaxID=2528027 RepID=A0A517TAJ0_9PLAN|nr:type II secretion system F family protein [Calycomorphotria hydatis]QDT65384.1 Bacterial type II secretion system protein F domain protein [Calycomorphotria hydatis]